MRSTKIIALILPLLIGACFFGTPTRLFALGASPAITEINNLPHNASVTQEITISRGNPSEDQRAKITLSGVGAPNITLPKGDIIPLPKGEEQVRFPITVNSGNLSQGTYEADLKINILPGEVAVGETGTGSTVLTGVILKVRFFITNDAIEDYVINKAHVQPTEEGQPFGFSYELVNRGNVDARPAKIDLSITSATNSEVLYTQSFESSELLPVASLSTAQVDILTKAQLATGRYKALLHVFDKNQKEIFTDTLSFEVFPAGTLAQKGALISFTSDKDEYEPGETAKFSGTFQNMGDVGIAATLVIELSKGGKRLEIVKTPETFIPLKRSSEMEVYYKLEKGGAYTAKGFVTFGAQKSEEKEIHFTVKEISAILIGGLLVLVSIFIAGVLWFIKKSKKKILPPTPSETTPL